MTRLLLVAAALVAVLAAAGVGAGAELHVYPSAGTPIQTAIDGAGAGDTIYVHAGTYEGWASGSPEKFMDVPEPSH